MIKDFLILGRGTAACLSALYIKKFIETNQWKSRIRVVGSDKLGSLGAGEATTGKF